MKPTKLVAILLIIAGALGLTYGSFSYTKQTHRAEIGSMHLSIDEKQNVNVPVWAGLGMLVVGVLLLGVPTRN